MKSILCFVMLFATMFSAYAKEGIDCGDDLQITLTSGDKYKGKLNQRFTYDGADFKFEGSYETRMITEQDSSGKSIQVKEYIFGKRLSRLDYGFVYLQFLPTGEFFDLKVWSAGTLYHLDECAITGLN